LQEFRKEILTFAQLVTTTETLGATNRGAARHLYADTVELSRRAGEATVQPSSRSIQTYISTVKAPPGFLHHHLTQQIRGVDHTRT
jgi:hypothetical protein